MLLCRLQRRSQRRLSSSLLYCAACLPFGAVAGLNAFSAFASASQQRLRTPFAQAHALPAVAFVAAAIPSPSKGSRRKHSSLFGSVLDPHRARSANVSRLSSSTASNDSDRTVQSPPTDTRSDTTSENEQPGMGDKSSSLMYPFKRWDDGKERALERCVLPLTPDLHKGSSGRVGIVGGSAQYTGAPYYAAMASLKVGADLAFIFCAEEASLPLKCYSPELMVSPVYSADRFDELVDSEQMDSDEAQKLIDKMVKKVTSTLSRLHVLIIGPGLGRCPMVMKGVARIIQEAQAQNIPLVMDADGLFMLTVEEYRDGLFQNDSGEHGEIHKSPYVLTPNVVEYGRLMDSVSNDGQWKDAVICKKGGTDQIMAGPDCLLECSEAGGLKRPGGIGDLLCGTIGTMVAWNHILSEQTAKQDDSDDDKQPITADDLPLSCWTACCLVKHATKRAYEQHGRAMTAPDVLDELGPTADEFTNV